MELNYFEWEIPAGDRITLGLYRADELETMHNWKHQVDISFLTCRTVKRLSLQERKKQFKKNIPSAFAIRRLTDDQLIGEISVYDYNAKNRSIGIGYFTGPDYRRQGYTKESLQIMLMHLFNTVGINKVMANTGSFNQASITLLKSCGFQQDGCLREHQLFEGVLHDHFLFSLLAKEFSSRKPSP